MTGNCKRNVYFILNFIANPFQKQFEVISSRKKVIIKTRKDKFHFKPLYFGAFHI